MGGETLARTRLLSRAASAYSHTTTATSRKKALPGLAPVMFGSLFKTLACASFRAAHYRSLQEKLGCVSQLSRFLDLLEFEIDCF